LKYAIDNGIINIDDIQAKKEMKNREEILSNHPYSVWESKNGYWYTYLPDEEKGRALKKRKTQKEIEDLIVTFYKGNSKLKSKEKQVKSRPRRTSDKNSFLNTFISLKEFKKDIINVSDNTIDKYNTDYNRFFKDTVFENMNIANIDDDYLIKFIVERIKALELTQSAANKMIDYISMTLKHGVFKKIIKYNPCSGIDKKIFKRHYKVEKSKTATERTVSDDQMACLNARFEYYYEKKPRYIPVYAVELASMTGFRVGELAALRWDLITKDKIKIEFSEKYNRVTKEYYIDSTKNEKVREFPITPEIADLLKRLYEVEKKYGYLTEYVFSNEEGRVHCRTISECSRSLCIYMGMEAKSIHALRRTVSSKLQCNGVPRPIVAALLGHTEEVNEKHYTYDVSSDSKKYEFISKMTQNIKGIAG